MQVQTTTLRQLINEAFDDEAFYHFCFDHYRPVTAKFSTGQTKSARIQMLLEHIERNGLTDEFLNKIKAESPYQYQQYFSNSVISEPAPKSEAEESTGIKVFISYAREDVETVRKFYQDLKRAGFLPWFDEEDLLPGQNWKTAINKAMKDCRFFIAVMSTQSLDKRGFVQKEIRMALDMLDEFPEGDIFFIPVRLDECKPQHERLQSIHFADLFPSYENGLKKIMKTLQSG